MMKRERPLNHVVYHSPCPDGAFGALCAHHYFNARQTPESILDEIFKKDGNICGVTLHDIPFLPNDGAVYLPYSHSSPEDAKNLKSIPDGDVVYFIDCIGPPGFLGKACARFSKVIVLDHHKTAKEELDEMKKAGELPVNLEVVMTMDRSGATIAYDYFVAKVETEGRGFHSFGLPPNLHKILQYVEDNDLWRHHLENSKVFYAGLGYLKIEYDHTKNRQLFEHLMSVDFDATVELGLSVMVHREEQLVKMLKLSFTVQLKDLSGVEHTCLAAHATSFGYVSDLGHRLAVLGSIKGLMAMGVVCSVDSEGGKMKISLRSLYNQVTNPEGVDTTQFSKVYGGGGHTAASGFSMSHRDFNIWCV